MKKVSYLYQPQVHAQISMITITFTPPGHEFKGTVFQQDILGRMKTPEKITVSINTELLAPPDLS